MLIDGNEIAKKILKELGRQLSPEQELAAILVGDDAASLSFLRKKQDAAQSLGVKFKLYQFSSTLSQDQLERKVAAIAADSGVGGLIIQLPLPSQYDRVSLLNKIPIEKDVDVLNGETSKVLAPAAGALMRILQEINFDMRGKRAVVVGSGLLIGKPIISWLSDKAESVTVINKGGYSPDIVRQADLVVSGTGVARLIKGDHLKKSAVVIDFGYGRDESDELAGDVDMKSAAKVAGYITPTPGGTGPIVVAMLFNNFYKLAS